MINDGGSNSRAPAEIVDAARQLIADFGWGAAGSARVAKLARVSKALVHYHFQNRRTLLVAVAASCRRRITERTGADRPHVLRHENPVDNFTEWLGVEIDSADLRIALQLSMAPDDEVRSASSVVRAAYRGAAERRVVEMFMMLELIPRISEVLIVDLVVCMSEGMATGHGGSRQAVDALCLSLLTLAD